MGLRVHINKPESCESWNLFLLGLLYPISSTQSSQVHALPRMILSPTLCHATVHLQVQIVFFCWNIKNESLNIDRKKWSASWDSCPVVLAQCVVRSPGCVHVWRHDNRTFSVWLPHFLQHVFIAASLLHSLSRSRKPLTSDMHARTHTAQTWLKW